jgi:hypothetical protein
LDISSKFSRRLAVSWSSRLVLGISLGFGVWRLRF